MKRCFSKINEANLFSSIMIKKKGDVTLHMAFKTEQKATIRDVKVAIDDCGSIITDINNNTTSIKLGEMKPIETPGINITSDNIVFKPNTKLVFMNIIIPFKYDPALINLDKLYEFSKNFPNFLSKLPKENLPSVDNSSKDGISIRLKYNRVSGFANMNQIMTTIDILKQKNEPDIIVIRTIEKLYQKSMEEAKAYLLEWKKKFSALTSSKIDPKFKLGILVTITKSTIKLYGITKIYQIPMVYKFFTTFMTLYFMQNDLQKSDKNFKKYFVSHNKDKKNISFSSTKNNENIPYENLNLAAIDYRYDDYEINNDIYIEENIKKIQEEQNESYNQANNYSRLASINKRYKNMGLATNDQIAPELKLTCDDVVVEVDTCEDLCSDSKYFLRRLQRYDNRLFKFNVSSQNSKKRKQYSRTCQKWSQPVILPYNPEEEPKIDRRSFSYTVKYSTDPAKPRWYICPKFWCPYCEIPIFDADVDPSTIKVRKTEGEGSKCNVAKCPKGDHQILYRDNSEYYPGFQAGGDHPEGFCLPCCFKLPHNDPKYPDKYREFQKCLGVNVANEAIDSSKIYIVGKTSILNLGKYAILPYAVAKLLGSKLKPGYLGLERGFLRKGIKQEDNNSFLACVADILTCDKVNGFWTYQKIKKVILEKLNDKLFRSLDAGNLYVLFDDKTKNITPMENFINYVNHNDILMRHEYLWDLLQRPGILFESGANIVIFENESILCPFGENIENFYDSTKHTVMMLKNGYKYEPIYFLEGNGKTAIHTCIYPPTNKNVEGIINLCKKECANTYDINWDLVLRDNINKYKLELDNVVSTLGPDLQTVLNEILTSIKNKKLSMDFIPFIQYIDSYNKVFAIGLKNGLFVPIHPSKINDKINYKELFNYDKLKLLDLNTTIKYLTELSSKTGLKYVPNHKIMDLKKGDKIVAIVTELNKIIPVVATNNTSSNKLKVSNFSYYSDADEALQQKIVIIDKRIEQINKKNYEDETYQRMRFELSKFLKISKNKHYFDAIVEIINEDENDVNKTRKKIYSILNEIFKEITSFRDNDIDYQFYKTPNTRTPCFMRTVIKNNKHAQKRGNINLFSCSDDPHCTSDKNECKLFINKTNLLTNERQIQNYDFYMAMIIDELVRYRLKRYEILNDKIAYIIDKEKVVLNPKKYIIIYNMASEDIERMIDLIFEDNKGINIDKRRLFEETTTKIFSFQRDKYVMGISKFTYSTEKLSGRWESLLGRKYIVQKNLNPSIYLSMSYSLIGLNTNIENQNSKTIINIIKRKVCDFIEKHDTDLSMVLKFAEIMSSKKNNASVMKKNNSVVKKLQQLELSNKGLANKVAKYNNNNNSSQISTLLELYQKELFKQKNEYKLISSTEKLVREIMNDGYTGCILDIIITSIIYNVNIIILNKRHYREANQNFTYIGPQFGVYNDNILLYKSSLETDIKTFVYNIIRSGSDKYLFKQNELPPGFIKFIKTA